MVAAVNKKIDLVELRDKLRLCQHEQALTRTLVVHSVRLVESHVVDMLDGGTLRGLSNLAPPWHSARYFAFRVSHGEGVRYRGLSKTGEALLAISKRGLLVRARVVGENAIEERHVLDDEILIEDLEPIARAYVECVERHAETLGRNAEATAYAAELAKRLSTALRG
jgi:hypothetical protein